MVPMMDIYPATVHERSTLTFCVEGLLAREELLFKAFVRLLDHLTHQQWRYQPATAENRIDLLVVAEGVQPTYCKSSNQAMQPVLRLGTTGANGHGILSWPLKPNEIEKELNRIGESVIIQRSAQQTLALSTSTSSNALIAPVQSMKLMRLQQWPPRHLLEVSGRMRLATLLTGKAMSLEELVFRSALPLRVCEAFVNELQQAGLLMWPASASRPLPVAVLLPKQVEPSLLTRIRMRLGIQKSDSRA